jgi:hypothetical protein
MKDSEIISQCIDAIYRQGYLGKVPSKYAYMGNNINYNVFFHREGEKVFRCALGACVSEQEALDLGLIARTEDAMEAVKAFAKMKGIDYAAKGDLLNDIVSIHDLSKNVKDFCLRMLDLCPLEELTCSKEVLQFLHGLKEETSQVA